MGGGDKCLLEFGGRTLLDWILARIRPQVGTVVLNANGDPARFAQFDLPVVPDMVDESLGPLLGILSRPDLGGGERPGRPMGRHRTGRHAFSARRPCRPVHGNGRRTGCRGRCAVSGGRTYPPCSLWKVDLAGELRDAVIEGPDTQDRSVDGNPPNRTGRIRDGCGRSVLQRQQPRGPAARRGIGQGTAWLTDSIGKRRTRRLEAVCVPPHSRFLL